MSALTTTQTSILSRLAFWKECIWKPWWGLAMLAYTIFTEGSGIVDFASYIFGTDVRDYWPFLRKLPELPVWVWIVGIALILSVAVMECAYRKCKDMQVQLDEKRQITETVKLLRKLYAAGDKLALAIIESDDNMAPDIFQEQSVAWASAVEVYLEHSISASQAHYFSGVPNVPIRPIEGMKSEKTKQVKTVQVLRIHARLERLTNIIQGLGN